MSVSKWILLVASVCVFFGGLVYSIKGRRRRKLLIWIGFLAASIFLIKLFWGERPFFSIIVDIMQTFSLDADYSELTDVPALFAAPLANWLLVIYMTIIYAAAPISGVAVIWEMLASFSPYVHLFFSRRRQFFIFSGLTEKSVILAEDIATNGKGNKPPVIVFTDAYADDKKEAESELLMRAKNLGGVCLRDDMLHCRYFRSACKCSFFLMDEGENGDFDDEANLTGLHGLLVPKEKPVWNAQAECDIFIFANNSGTIESIRAVKEAYDKKTKQPEGPAVRVNVIRDFAQTALFLMRDKPLYGPLVGPEYKEARDGPPARPLRVAVFGGGPLALELFKTVFWCGQIWNTRLYITVVSPPAGEGGAEGSSFRRLLDRLCPEIVPSCTGGDECLRIYPGDGRDAFGEPYCTLSFLEEDMEKTNIRTFLERPGRVYLHSREEYCLADYDYFLVAGPSDGENIRQAEDIRSALIRFQLTEGRRESRGRPVIALSVGNQTLSDIMRSRYEQDNKELLKNYSPQQPGGDERLPEMYVFGGLKDRYSWGNVSVDQKYLNQSAASPSGEHGFADIGKSKDSIYDDWSEIGRIFHLRYRMYSAGLAPEAIAGDKLDVKRAYYEKVKSDPANETLRQRLSWLEHRRWNAFLRAQGFSRPFDRLEKLYLEMEKVIDGGEKPNRLYAYKDVRLRLHPCLVECAKEPTGEIYWQDGDGKLRFSWDDKRQNIVGPQGEHYDLLDYITLLRSACEGKRKDLKKYDSPDPKVSPKYLPLLSEEEIRALCGKAGVAAAAFFELEKSEQSGKGISPLGQRNIGKVMERIETIKKGKETKT